MTIYFILWYLIGFVSTAWFAWSQEDFLTVKDILLIIGFSFLGIVMTIFILLFITANTGILNKKVFKGKQYNRKN